MLAERLQARLIVNMQQQVKEHGQISQNKANVAPNHSEFKTQTWYGEDQGEAPMVRHEAP